MAKSKCTHPRGFDRFGRCPICRQKKRGRKPKTRIAAPRIAAPSVPPSQRIETPPTVTPSHAPLPNVTPPTPPQTTAPPAGPSRAERIAAWSKGLDPTNPPTYPEDSDPSGSEPPPEPEPEEIEHEPQPDDSPEDEPRMSLGYSWPWVADKVVLGIDVAAGAAIERFTTKIPLEAGEEETEELKRVTAEYAQQKLGDVELPIWLVFLIALFSFVLSKYLGAETNQQKVANKPEPKPLAPAADSTTQGSAGDVISPETHHHQPTITPAAGYVADANGGF